MESQSVSKNSFDPNIIKIQKSLILNKILNRHKFFLCLKEYMFGAISFFHDFAHLL